MVIDKKNSNKSRANLPCNTMTQNQEPPDVAKEIFCGFEDRTKIFYKLIFRQIAIISYFKNQLKIYFGLTYSKGPAKRNRMPKKV